MKNLIISGMGLGMTILQGLVKHATAKGLSNNDIHWLSRQQDAEVEKTLMEMASAMADVLQKAKSRIGRTFTIIRGGNRTTEQVVGTTKHTYVNEHINSKNFPLTQGPEEGRELIAFQVDYDPSFDEVVAEIKKRGLEQPTYEDGLKFDEAHPDEKGVFVFPHKPWHDPDGYPGLLVVDRDDVGRGLDLGCTAGRWHRRCWFVGVRPRK